MLWAKVEKSGTTSPVSDISWQRPINDRAHHPEEFDEVAFAGPICADQDVDIIKRELVQLDYRTETTKGYGFEGGAHGSPFREQFGSNSPSKLGHYWIL